MNSFSSEDTPERDPRAQILFGPGEALVVKGVESWKVTGFSRGAIERVLALVDGRRTVRAIVDDSGSDRAATARILDLLRGNMLRAARQETETIRGSKPLAGGRRLVRVAVVGNGELGLAIREELALAPAFETELCSVEAPSVAEIRALVVAHDAVVCALEGVRYRAILDVNAECVETVRPFLPVIADGDQIALGPTVVGNQRACFGCAVLDTTFANYPDPAQAAKYVTELTAGRAERTPLLYAAARAVRDELGKIGTDPFLAGRILRVTREGFATTDVGVRFDCPFCRARPPRREPAAVFALGRQSSVSISLNADRRAESEVRGAPKTQGEPYKTVGILGGGTAGYMTALALRTRRPELSVTLIESSKIPIIGVGEATTPRLLDFLHSRSGLDIVDFYRRVLPTWKLGIEFFWGLPGDYTFRGAFQFASLLEPMVYRGNMETYSLGCALMERDRVPVFANDDGSYTSFLHRIAFAYHLDNVRFVRYLTEEAKRLGVRQLDRVVVDAELAPDGENVECLLDDGGERHRFDLYVDASGFRSFLLEKKLGSPFIGYETSLFTDSAVMGDVPNGGVIKPYTRAETMDNGWCWTIPFHESDHRGYVFSSAFTTVERAVDEFRRKNPAVGDVRALKFRSGRHEDFWRGNVLAVGNAYAFVEPLESTGLEMLSIELDLVVDHFPKSRHDRGVKRALSEKLGRMWDNLRGLLAIHYKFNQKFDTEFWRACRSDTDLASAETRVRLFADRAPLSYSRALLRADDPVADFFSQDYIYDVLLCGQGAPATFLEPFESREAMEERRRHYRMAADWAIPQAKALRLLAEEPETLVSVFDSAESWIRLRRY